jgi:hypothetical protein
MEAGVFQEPATWDLRYINREPSMSMKLYLLFLLFCCLLTSVELFKAWHAAPPFKLSRQASNRSYVKMLEASRTRLKHWILCIFLAMGILTSLNISDACNLLLAEKTMGLGVVLFVIRDYGAEVTMGFIVVLFAFLVRWHFTARIERLVD